MSGFFRRLKVAHKLGLAVCIFAVPVAFVLWSLVAEQRIAIAFAAQEVAGARYLEALVPLQADAAALALGKAQGDKRLADRLASIQERQGHGLDADAQALAAIEALRDPAALDGARAKLRDLIVRIGDRSNLILDNVLDTYYLTDVVLNRLPDILDREADLAPGQAGADSDARSQFLLGLGMLVSDLDGMDASVASAQQADGGDAIRAAIESRYKPLKAALDAFAVSLRDGRPHADAARALLAETARLDADAAAALTRLLEARVSGLYGAQLQVLGITAALFALAVLAMLTVMRRAVTAPLGRLSGATVKLAVGDLDTQLPVVRSTDELGAMASALEVFKRQAI